MPTHSLLPFVESPDGLAQDVIISNNASVPGPGSSMTPHAASYSEKAALQSGGDVPPLSCTFCDQTFTHQEELGPHVMAEHPITLCEPAVLRVEAEFRIPGDRQRHKPGNHAPPVEKAEVHSCIVCGQVSQDAAELEGHMRKHKDYFTYCCGVCGRRFREPWFLKNHMKMHVRPGAKSKAQQELEAPYTINDVVQDPPPEPVATVYKMCMVCGFFFPDHESLVEHSKVHNREVEPGKEENMDVTTDPLVKQETFLHGLKLLPRSESPQQERSSKWIQQLDPFNTYQAWQLATKGKIAVGPNTNKDLGQEASTDNEDCSSDKEETSNMEVRAQQQQQQQQVPAETPEPKRRSLMQKDKLKERPTTCEDCQRTFRTYHQLVLHSRVHKRERGGEESPTFSGEGKLSRAGSFDNAEEGGEEGFEEAALAENMAAGEDGFDRSKARSKECSYCGKSFRSSYYLTVHLRTHTGEKPFKCAYCDYAAAQKTSLKYHLDRRHKDKPLVDIPSRPAPSPPAPSPPAETKHGQNGIGENGATRSTKLWVPGSRTCAGGKPEDTGFGAEDTKPGKLLVQMGSDYEKLITKSPIDDVVVKCHVPVNLKMEREEVKDEPDSEAPLNLSLKVSLSIPAGAETRTALVPTACPFCAYKTMYPEVLMMHKKLNHKDKSDGAKRLRFAGGSAQRRFTGCPPALDGKDVSPLPMIDRRHPRRTKSPPPLPPQPPPHPLSQPAKTQEKTPVNPPKRSPIRTPQHEAVQKTTNQETPRYVEHVRKQNPKPAERPAPAPAPLPDRVGIGETSYPARGGVIWHSDAARLCLSSRFWRLPQVDFGDPSGKRLKFSGREGDAGERSGGRGGAGGGAGGGGDGPNRLLVSGRSVKTTSAVSENPAKATPSPMGGGLDADWGMMNLLHSYPPTDLASLYPGNGGAGGAGGGGGLANPRAGGRTVLYQHLPTLPTHLQRRDPPGPYPTPRYGTADKTT